MVEGFNVIPVENKVLKTTDLVINLGMVGSQKEAERKMKHIQQELELCRKEQKV